MKIQTLTSRLRQTPELGFGRIDLVGQTQHLELQDWRGEERGLVRIQLTKGNEVSWELGYELDSDGMALLARVQQHLGQNEQALEATLPLSSKEFTTSLKAILNWQCWLDLSEAGENQVQRSGGLDLHKFMREKIRSFMRDQYEELRWLVGVHHEGIQFIQGLLASDREELIWVGLRLIAPHTAALLAVELEGAADDARFSIELRDSCRSMLPIERRRHHGAFWQRLLGRKAAQFHGRTADA